MLSQLSGIEIFIFFISILISMTFHEAMHGYVAHWLGDTTPSESGRLTFNPLKSIDLITTVLLPVVLVIFGFLPFFAAKPVPINPSRLKHGDYGLALVGIAGPATNLVLAILGGIVFRLWGVNQASLIYNSVVIFTEVNIGFLIFNLIPFPPLDGSRVLYAFAPEALQEFMVRIESYGFLAILAFMFIVFQFISGPISNLETHLLNLLLT
jgi:Zn-dependent protease